MESTVVTDIRKALVVDSISLAVSKSSAGVVVSSVLHIDFAVVGVASVVSASCEFMVSATEVETSFSSDDVTASLSTEVIFRT